MTVRWLVVVVVRQLSGEVRQLSGDIPASSGNLPAKSGGGPATFRQPDGGPATFRRGLAVIPVIFRRCPTVVRRSPVVVRQFSGGSLFIILNH